MADHDRIEQMIRDGCKNQQIVDETGCSSATIYRVTHERGLLGLRKVGAPSARLKDEAIAQMVRDGKTNREIVAELDVHEATITRVVTRCGLQGCRVRTGGKRPGPPSSDSDDGEPQQTAVEDTDELDALKADRLMLLEHIFEQSTEIMRLRRLLEQA